MTQEEKAKAYDEAIEKARQLCAYPTSKPFISDLQYLFPALAESEDEKIRKDIISYVEQAIAAGYGIISKERKEIWIAWLEKQGEHAKFRDSIQVGDKVTRNEDGVLVNLSQLNRVAKKQTEQKLYVNDNAKEMFIKALERVEEQNNKGYKLTDCDKNSWWEDFKTYTSCTVEQKPAWSEEDEEMLVDAYVMLDWYKGNNWWTARRIKDWLNSLKERIGGTLEN